MASPGTSKMDFALTSPQYSVKNLYFGITTGVAQVQTVTVANFAGTAQGDFIVITNGLGAKQALWMDKDAAGTQPTASAYLAVNNRVPIAIVTGNTAAQVGAALAAALTLAGVTAVDNADGTVTFTQTYYGAPAVITRSNAAGSGNGSMSIATDVAGVDVVVGNGKFDATILQTAAGYTITYDEPFLRAPELAITCTTDNRIPRILTSTTLACTFEAQNVATGATADSSVSVIITGSGNASGIK